MHMADALLSPAVGGIMLGGAVAAGAYSVKKLKNGFDDSRIPLMGVAGAFVFAAQMINFTIPGTGSSGHLGGGILLAALIGPHAGYLAMASILLIQALFFADGGLLAFGCNAINMGFLTCFLAYTLIYRPIAGRKTSGKRLAAASMLASVGGLQLGALAVVIETLLSGKSELPFGTFLLFMQPIHLAIGLGEGLITSAVLLSVYKARPELLVQEPSEQTVGPARKWSGVVAGLAIAAVLTGGVVSWFASEYPDGLEWSIANAAGQEEPEGASSVHQTLAKIQESLAFLPDYGFKEGEAEQAAGTEASSSPVSLGTSVSGVTGGVLTLGLIALIGGGISLAKKRKKVAA